MLNKQSVVIVLGSLLGLPVIAAPVSIPIAAKKQIDLVHNAAKRHDLYTLRSLMIDDFNWSFGGDLSASQAISDWQQHAHVVDFLAEATAGRCVFAKGIVECANKGSGSYRVGFKATEKGWLMIYFVAGD